MVTEFVKDLAQRVILRKKMQQASLLISKVCQAKTTTKRLKRMRYNFIQDEWHKEVNRWTNELKKTKSKGSRSLRKKIAEITPSAVTHVLEEWLFSCSLLYSLAFYQWRFHFRETKVPMPKKDQIMLVFLATLKKMKKYKMKEFFREEIDLLPSGLTTPSSATPYQSFDSRVGPTSKNQKLLSYF